MIRALLFRVLIFLAVAAFLSGCGGKMLYNWGYYEDSIYNMYLAHGKATVEDEILRLEAQIEETVASGRFVPPGLHAHLAYLYITNGDYATALVHLQAEKEKFPESAHFIDGIIERMQK